MVYGANDVNTRKELWRALEDVRPSIDTPWLVLGDFHVIRFAHEKDGGGMLNWHAMEDLNVCIDNMMLLELPTAGKQFTWTNSSHGTARIATRLDRALCNDAWLELYPGASCFVGDRELSDHNALVLRVDAALQPRRSLFKFVNAWTWHTGFLDVVRDAWASHHEGTPMYRLVSKLDVVRVRLREWSRSEFGDVSRRVSRAREGLEQARLEAIANPDQADVQAQVRACEDDLAMRLAVEESVARQGSRIKWLLEGDSNTRFFHATIRARRARNTIRRIDDAGVVLEDESQIRYAFRRRFSSLFANNFQVEPIDDGLVLPTLSDHDAQLLVRHVTLDEIQGVVMATSDDRAPGPDVTPGSLKLLGRSLKTTCFRPLYPLCATPGC